MRPVCIEGPISYGLYGLLICSKLPDQCAAVYRTYQANGASRRLASSCGKSLVYTVWHSLLVSSRALYLIAPPADSDYGRSPCTLRSCSSTVAHSTVTACWSHVEMHT